MSTQTLAVTPDTLRLGSPEELKHQRFFIKESDTSRGLLFNSILEVVRWTKSEAEVRHCQEVEGEPKFVDVFSHPLSKFVTLIYAAARLLSAETGDFEGALRQLGQQTAANVLTSASGKMMMTLVQQNPQRLCNSLRESPGGGHEHGAAHHADDRTGERHHHRQARPPPPAQHGGGAAPAA